MQYIFRLPLGMLFFKVRALALRPARGDAKCSIARHILCNIFSAYGKDFACVSLFQAFRLPPRSRKISRLASTMDSGFYAIIFSVQASPAACLDVDGIIFLTTELSRRSALVLNVAAPRDKIATGDTGLRTSGVQGAEAGYDLPRVQWQQAEVVDKTLLSELLQERAIHAMPPLTRNWRKP